MADASETKNTSTAPTVSVSASAPCGPGASADSPAIICDLADSDAFVEVYRKPHVPIMASFGAGRLHVCRLFGSWDLDKAASENASALFRSMRKIPPQHIKDSREEWDDLTFQFGPRSYIYLDNFRIVGFATTPVEAERLAKNFGKAYALPPAKPDDGGDYYLIRMEAAEIKCHQVSLPAETLLTPETLEIGRAHV